MIVTTCNFQISQLKEALKLRVISHRFRCFDEHFTFSHLPLVALHVDSIHQMLHSSPHVTIPPRPSLFGKYSISGDQIKKKIILPVEFIVKSVTIKINSEFAKYHFHVIQNDRVEKTTNKSSTDWPWIKYLRSYKDWCT